MLIRSSHSRALCSLCCCLAEKARRRKGDRAQEEVEGLDEGDMMTSASIDDLEVLTCAFRARWTTKESVALVRLSRGRG